MKNFIIILNHIHSNIWAKNFRKIITVIAFFITNTVYGQVPGSPSSLFGPTTISPGTTSSVYNISPETGATGYSWSIEPGSAGTISASDTRGTVTWNSSYSGTATVMVSGVNTYGTGPPATLTITVNSGTLQSGVASGTQSINYGATPTAITATAATGGSGTITYQWQSSTGGGAFADIVGATSLSYPASALTTTTSFQLIATGNGTSVTSNIVTVTVYPQLMAGAVTPSNQSVTYNTAPITPLTASAATGGNGTYTYQWQSSTSGVFGSFTNITGATTTAYQPSTILANAYYQLLATSNGVSVTSNVAKITVTSQPFTGVISPSSQIIYPGAAASRLNCTAATGGNGTFSYQWQESPIDSGANYTWTNVPGANSLTHNPNPFGVTLTASIAFRMAVIMGSDTVFSAPATIMITNCIPLNTMASQNMNYVITSTPRIGGITDDISGLANRSACDLMQTIQYLDGLGRPLQTVQVAGSGTENDLIQPYSYDQFGRDSVQYLPYSNNTPTPGGYNANAVNSSAGYTGSNQYLFYQNSGQDHVNTPYPLSGTNYEPSPLSRKIEQGAPGAAWQLSTTGVNSTSHTMNISYASNDQSTFNRTQLVNNPGSRMAVMYAAEAENNLSRVLLASGYRTGTLYVTISKNENWNSGADGCLNTIEEYKDQQGKVVLKRTYNQKGTALEMLSTYYVYDNFDNLAFVLPPGANPDSIGAVTTTMLNNYCYQYRYDQRKRLVQKKLPGKGWEYIVYNDIDEPVATQDSLMRALNEWTYTKYDNLDRIIQTGLWNPGTYWSWSSLQAAVNGNTTLWETIAATNTGYSNTAWPTNLTTPLTLNYYDGYTTIPAVPTSYNVATGVSVYTRGLLTATKTAVLNTPTDMLWNVNYYDDLGRPIKTYKQHYLSGTVNANNYDAVSDTYNFTNTVTATTRQHYTSANTTVPRTTISNQFFYDQMGRKLGTWEQIQNGSQAPDTRTLLWNADYNEIGQLLDKGIHSTDSLDFLQYQYNYYNERGWLANTVSMLFAEQMNYTTGSNPQYNGNIASVVYGPMMNQTNRFNYSYDKLNRLVNGTSGDNNYSEHGITYDKEGNIGTLSRVYNGALIDSLTYTYNNTNQLQSIHDLSPDTSPLGYKLGTFPYHYDGNGNMTADSSKGIHISYNILNLPQSIPALGTTYVYSASGQKLRRITNGYATDYIDGIEYDGSTTETMTFIQTEEGRAIPDGATAYNYEYNLSDHLGNTRITFDTGTGSSNTVQQDDYMPFGMDILTGPIPNPENNYLYNKKEIQRNLNVYDFGARVYDPVIGRWSTIDPLAEKSRRLNPYNYVENNPIRNIDPDGMDPLTGQAAQDAFAAAQQQTIANNTGADGLNMNGWLAIQGFGGDKKEKSGDKKNDGHDNQGGNVQDLRNKIVSVAENYEGSTAWAYNKSKGNFPAGCNKCNLYVNDVLRKAGASPGLPHNHGTNPYTAADWANPFLNIPGWKVLTSSQPKMPGDIVAVQENYSDATGHVGIVIGPNLTSSFSSITQSVTENDWGFRSDNGGWPVFRRYVGP